MGVVKGIKISNLKIFPPQKKGIVKGIKTSNLKIPPKNFLGVVKGKKPPTLIYFEKKGNGKEKLQTFPPQKMYLKINFGE